MMQNGSQFRERMARVVVDLNNMLADAQSGSLIQIWMPDCMDGNVVLQTQGLPYAVTGTGDLLALFRCVSCRYRFSTDPVMQPKLLGAVGRVFTSSEPEMCNDLQKYHSQVYLRVNEAQRCRVHSTLVMPFFENATRDKPMGVLEVVKNSKNVNFKELLDRLTSALAGVNLYCCDLDARAIEVGLRKWPLEVDVSVLDMVKPAVEDVTAEGAERSGMGESLSEGSIKARSSMLKSSRSQDTETVVSSLLEKESSKDFQSNSIGSSEQLGLCQSGSVSNLMTLPQGGSAPNLTTLAHSASGDLSGMNYQYQPYMNSVVPVYPSQSGGHYMSPSPMGPCSAVPYGPSMPSGAHMNNCHDMSQALLRMQKFQRLLQDLTPGPRRSKGDGRRGKTSMGTGRHLSFEDLKRHMNVGLKEAAGQLGICPTTLKRACRRNGITRWPCRQLAKLNKTMSELGYKGPPPDDVLKSALRGQLKTSSLTKELNSASEGGQAGSPSSKGNTAAEVETQCSMGISLDGPQSAPAGLLADSEGNLLGSSSSQGLLSAVIGDQDYEWLAGGEDGDDDIGPEDDDEPPSASGSAPSADPLQNSLETLGSMSFPASCVGLTFNTSSPENLGTRPQDSEVHGSTALPVSEACVSDNIPFDYMLKDGFDMVHLDLDAEMPDLS